MSKKTVEEYIAELEPWQGEIVAQVRRIVVEAAPEAEESIKWAQPVYELNGPFAYIKAFKISVNFGFWRGVDIQDAKGLLQGSGDKMRHVRLSNVADIDHEAFTGFIHQAIKLNMQKGDPTKTP